MLAIVCFFIIFCEALNLSNEHVISGIITSLNKLLDFVLDNHEAMNVDGIFGISRTQAYLEDALPHINNLTIKLNLLNLIHKAETVYFLQLPNLPEYPFKYHVFKKYLLPPRNWRKEVRFLNDKLPMSSGPDAKSYNKNNATEFKMNVLNSKFDESLFDDCLVEMITLINFNRLSHVCFEYLIELPKIFGGEFSGYRVTHMLLFLQVGRMRECLFDANELSNMIQNECSYILWEVGKNIEFGFIPRLLDLLLEQIDLCGYEGFQEFFQKPLLDYVLKSQNQHGCFKTTSYVGGESKTKRESTMMKHSCNSHSTGLASSVLALFLRAYLIL